MGKIRRGNFIFVSWIGDHGYHIHVYKDGRLVLKWDLTENKAITGIPTRRLLRIIEELKEEGLI